MNINDNDGMEIKVPMNMYLFSLLLRHNDDAEYHDSLEEIGDSLDKKITELINNPDKIDFTSLTDIEKYKIKKMNYKLYMNLLLSANLDDLSIREASQIYKLNDNILFLRRFMFCKLMRGWDNKGTNYVSELFNLYGYDLCMDNAPIRFYKQVFTQFKDSEYEDVKKFVLEKKKSNN